MPPVAACQPRAGEGDEEERGEHVREAQRARDLPLQLREGDGEERREEEDVGDASRSTHGSRVHVASATSSASSSARAAAREPVARLLGKLGRRQAAVSEAADQLRRAPPSGRLDVVGRRDHARAGLADQVGRGAVRRHGGEDRPLGREVLEDLPGEDAAAAAARLRDQQQKRLGVALQLERAPARRVRDQLEPVAEARGSPPTRGRRSGSRRRSARRRRRDRTRRARSGTAAGRACRRSCRCA